MTARARRFVALALAASLGACAAAPRERSLELRWPAVQAPPAASGLGYEVVVWRCDGTVPTRELLREQTTRTALRVDTTGWPHEVRWSVRARWRERGEARQTRWLDAKQRPIATAIVPSDRFARL